MKSMNVKFQLNLFSFMGLYGKEVQKKANVLQKVGMYDYVGTDLHRLEILRSYLVGNI